MIQAYEVIGHIYPCLPAYVCVRTSCFIYLGQIREVGICAKRRQYCVCVHILTEARELTDFPEFKDVQFAENEKDIEVKDLKFGNRLQEPQCVKFYPATFVQPVIDPFKFNFVSTNLFFQELQNAYLEFQFEFKCSSTNTTTIKAFRNIDIGPHLTKFNCESCGCYESTSEDDSETECKQRYWDKKQCISS